ncbi:hypothetical protein [Nostoc sp.]|uniref:hypothetical protein n=1 Tax=Nostoc sp. TaxID=1180 RepID=UPI003594386A
MICPFSPPDFPTMYRCIGMVQGKYLPSSEAFNQGILVTDDGNIYSATLASKLEKSLQDNRDLVDSGSSIWVVWPRMETQSKKLNFHLRGRLEATLDFAKNYFSIRGVVRSQENGKLSVQIWRNFRPPLGYEKAMQWQPFTLEVEGSVAQQFFGDFWELDVCLIDSRLVLEDGRLIIKFPKPRKNCSVNAENHLIAEVPKETNAQTPLPDNQISLTVAAQNKS